MTTTQLEKALIESTKGLPKDALLEILDFAKFLREKTIKRKSDSITSTTSHLDSQEIAHLEEEFKDYKKLYPRD